MKCASVAKLFVVALVFPSAVARGQDMSGMVMPMPAEKAPSPPVAIKPAAKMDLKAKVKPASEPAVNTRQMMPGMPMSEVAAPAAEPAATALAAGNAGPPPVPTFAYADRQYAPGAIAAANTLMMHQQGDEQFYQLMFNLAEFQLHEGHDGYRWDGEAWFGGDINRVELRSEGTGELHTGVGNAEVQALYSRAIGPYFNLEAGIRQDFAPVPTRTYATIGVEGLAPFMFQTEARLFVSTHGEVFGRLEAWYDQRMTQRLVLQPRVELNLAAQATPQRRIGSGLYDAELGLRLRYEITRQFAPYLGVSYETQTGRTAAFTRADGKDPRTTSVVAGVRFWL